MASRRERYEMSLVKRTFAAGAQSSVPAARQITPVMIREIIGNDPGKVKEAQQVYRDNGVKGFLSWIDEQFGSSTVDEFKRAIAMSNVSAADDTGNAVSIGPMPQDPDQADAVMKAMMQAGFKPMGWSDTHTQEWLGDPRKIPANVIRKFGVKNIKPISLSNVSAASPGTNLSKKIRVNFTKAGDAGAVKFAQRLDEMYGPWVDADMRNAKTFVIVSYDPAEMSPDLIVKLALRCGADKNSAVTTMSNVSAATGDSTSFDRYSKKIGNALADARTALKAAKTSIAALQTSGVSAPSGVNLDALNKYVTQAITVAMNASNELGMN